MASLKFCNQTKYLWPLKVINQSEKLWNYIKNTTLDYNLSNKSSLEI